MSANIRVVGPASAHQGRVLTAPAMEFVAGLHQRFATARDELLRRRELRLADFDKGALPDFLPSTHEVREDAWRVAPAPQDLEDRRVEITGPVEAKMMINGLNSGASVF